MLNFSLWPYRVQDKSQLFTRICYVLCFVALAFAAIQFGRFMEDKIRTSEREKFQGLEESVRAEERAAWATRKCYVLANGKYQNKYEADSAEVIIRCLAPGGTL